MGLFSSHSSHSSHHRPTYARSSSHYSRSSSYYKRRPRTGYINRLLAKLKHLLRELYYYARRHPIKVFMLVVMPLISGGVLAKLAAVAGFRLPAVLMGGMGTAGRGYGAYGGYYGSAGYGSAGTGNGLGGLMKVVQAFM